MTADQTQASCKLSMGLEWKEKQQRSLKVLFVLCQAGVFIVGLGHVSWAAPPWWHHEQQGTNSLSDGKLESKHDQLDCPWKIIIKKKKKRIQKGWGNLNGATEEQFSSFTWWGQEIHSLLQHSRTQPSAKFSHWADFIDYSKSCLWHALHPRQGLVPMTNAESSPFLDVAIST